MPSNMLDIEIPRPKYTLKVKVTDLGRHIVFFNDEEVINKMVLGSKGVHVFQRNIEGAAVEIKVILAMIGLTKCRCAVSENNSEVFKTEYPLNYFKNKNSLNWFPTVPAWSWIFIGLCILIPFVTLGGAVPAGIGIIGAMSCSSIASKNKWSLMLRVIICLSVTVVSWISLVIALSAIHTMMHK